MTVASTSPTPVTTVPSPLIVAVSPIGAVISGAVTATMGEALPAASLWTSWSAWPLAWAGFSVTAKLPSGAT